MLSLLRFLARASLSAIFINSGVDLLRNPEARAKKAAQELPLLPETPLLGQIHGAVMTGAGATLVLGIAPALSAAVLVAAMIPNTYVGHPFWKEQDPAARRQQAVHFRKNLAIIGGLLFVIAEERARSRS